MVILTICKYALLIVDNRILSGYIKIGMKPVNRIGIPLHEVPETRRILEDFQLMLLGKLLDNRHEPVQLIVVDRVVLRLVRPVLVVILNPDEMISLSFDLVVLEMPNGPLELRFTPEVELKVPLVQRVVHPVPAINGNPAVVDPVLELLQEKRTGFVKDDRQTRQELHRALRDEERTGPPYWRRCLRLLLHDITPLSPGKMQE